MEGSGACVKCCFSAAYFLVDFSFPRTFVLQRPRVNVVAFFSLSFPHYVTPTERERQTDKKNVFPAPNAHDDEPGAPVSLEQGEKPRRAEKAKTPSRGTIGVEIRVSVAELNGKRSVLEGGEALRRRRAKSKENAQIYVRYDSEKEAEMFLKKTMKMVRRCLNTTKREAKRFYDG